MIFSTLSFAMLVRLAVPALAALALLASACGEEEGAAASGGLAVVATTTQVADLARNVGGDRARVTGLLAANADPHDYEVRPSDVEAVAEAGVVLRSGGDLDEWLQEAIDGSGTEAPVLNLIERVQARPDDPHWWQDPRNAALAVAAIRDALVAADPGGAAAYRANATAYLAEIDELDRAVARCLETVPARQRKLVTTHDALAYYAARYDVEVVGTVIPSLSTDGQASAGELSALVDTIRAEEVEAIFAESSVDAKVERAVAAEAGATVGKALWADTLGPEGSDGATYLDSIAANTRALVEGLTGGERSCSLPR
jgi:zinc/manganese transport system substrate-binding protein/manganese/iron transport system substrate-binding protein